MPKLLICVVALLLASTQLSAQVPLKKIRGIVKDSITNEILENATVALYRLPDKVMITQARNTMYGYSFQAGNGTYIMITSFIGYANDTIRFSLASYDTLGNISPILLTKVGRNLTEVVVNATAQPVVIKGDTTVYNAGSFITRPGATVEDLLKKLPGVQVDKDGVVTVQGQKVQKIYVDGKDLINDPKMATQNVQADMIDKVEAFDNKSDGAREMSMTEGDGGAALNLKIKPGKKNTWNAKAYMSFGSRERYAAGTTANIFKNNSVLIGEMKSTNTSGLFNVNSLRNPGQISPGNNVLNNVFVNYGTVPNKKWNLNTGIDLTHTRFQNEVFNQRETFLSDSSLLVNRISYTNNEQISGRIGISGFYKYDSANTIRFRLSLTGSQSDNRVSSGLETTVQKGAGYRLNDGITKNKNKDKNFSSNMEISWTRRLTNKGRRLHVALIQSHTANNSDLQLFTLTQLVSDTIQRDQRTDQDAIGNTYRLFVSVAEPVGKGQYVQLGYNLNYTKNVSDRLTNNYDPATNSYSDIDTAATNRFRNSNQFHLWTVTYGYTRKKVKLETVIGLQNLSQHSRDLTGNVKSIDQRKVNVYSRVSLSYRISPASSFKLAYDGKNKQPGIEQLQPVRDYSNPLLIRLGNPDLKPEFTHEIRAGYTYNDRKKFSTLMIQANYSTISNRIVNSTIIDAQGLQQIQSVNINGNHNLGIDASYTLPIGSKKNGNAKFDSRLQYTRDISLFNAIENVRTSYSWQQLGMVSLRLKERFYADVFANVTLGKASYTGRSIARTSYFNQRYSCELSYLFSGDLTIASSWNYQINGKQTNLPSVTVGLWNASLSKRIFPKKAGEVRLSVFDILNANQNFSRTIGDNYIESTQSTVLQRFFLLSFIYKLR